MNGVDAIRNKIYDVYMVVFSQSRKTSGVENAGCQVSSGPGHKMGMRTRLMIESLDRIPFTPSQGICTPSPTNMAAMMVHHHHHHHVYGNGQPPNGNQINDAYLAGVAAGRADALERVAQGNGMAPRTSLIQAVYDSQGCVKPLAEMPGVQVNAHDERAEGNDDNDDATSIDYDSKAAETKPLVQDSKNRSKPLCSVDMDKARSMAYSICSMEGVHLTEGQSIPGELIDLASLLITLDIPLGMATCPADAFRSPKKASRQPTGFTSFQTNSIRLNARQRRTLRRAQERAWHMLGALKQEQQQNLFSVYQSASQQVYSPTCLNYGVNAAAFAEYNCMVVPPAPLVVPPSPPQMTGYGFHGPVLLSPTHHGTGKYHHADHPLPHVGGPSKHQPPNRHGLSRFAGGPKHGIPHAAE